LGTGQIGNGSFGQLAGPLTNMFDFSRRGPSNYPMILDRSTGGSQ
jgi:hypothetical protein